MKSAFLSALLLLVYMHLFSQAPADCSSGSKNREFDFWLGEWNVFNKQNIQVGKSVITKIINGCAIQENWTSLRGNSNYVGQSINVYNDEKLKWEQYWFGSGGDIKYAGEGEYKDGAMRFKINDKDNKGPFTANFIFYNDGPDKIRQFLERSYDGGKTWITIFEFTYNRIK